MAVTTYTGVNKSDSRLVFETTYANLIQGSQQAVWSFLRSTLENETTNAVKTKNVLDRVPENLAEGVGFPYVIVPLPTVAEEFLTFSQKRIMVVFDIEVWIKNSSTAVLIDRVRRALSANKNFFDSDLILHQFINTGSDHNIVELPNGDKVQQYRLTVQYEWIGVPS